MVQTFDVGVTTTVTDVSKVDTVAKLSSGTIDLIKDITKISSGTIDYITKVGSLGGTSDWRLVSDAVGLMKSTGGTVATLPSGTQDIGIVSDTIGLMKSTGGTVTVSSLGGTSDFALRERYYFPTTLWASTNTEASGTATSSWVDISKFNTKTVSIYCTQASTMIIEVTPTSSTATAYEYYKDTSVSANTYTTKSWTEVFFYNRIKIVTPTASTLDGWVGSQT